MNGNTTGVYKIDPIILRTLFYSLYVVIKRLLALLCLVVDILCAILHSVPVRNADLSELWLQKSSQFDVRAVLSLILN
jgi:hypothetical protein